MAQASLAPAQWFTAMAPRLDRMRRLNYDNRLRCMRPVRRIAHPRGSKQEEGVP